MRRLNIGGKLLTNYLKELVSYRQWNMMDEYILMNQVGMWLVICLASDVAVVSSKYHTHNTVCLQVKECLCYVSPDFMGELQAARLAGKVTRAPAAQPVGGNSDASSSVNTLVRTAPALDPMGGALKKQFVLPDFHTVLKGYVKPDDEPSDPTEQVCGYICASYTVPRRRHTRRRLSTQHAATQRPQHGRQVHTTAADLPHHGAGAGGLLGARGQLRADACGPHFHARRRQ
jgi:hypothetical protein